MKYVRADSIFPSELLLEMQKYISDGLVYIPKSKSIRKKWGELSGEKMRLDARNSEIKAQFKDSQRSLEALASEYHLSVETIKNIVYRR